MRSIQGGLLTISVVVGVFGVAVQSGAATGPPPVKLYVVGAGAQSNVACWHARDADMIKIAAAVTEMVRARLPESTEYGPVVLQDYLPPPARKPIGPPPDILQSNISLKRPAKIVIATVCRMFDVAAISIASYSISVDGQIMTNGAPPLSGSFDALESADKKTWASLFAPTPAPAPFTIGSTVAFLPVGNDTNGIINPRLLRNLPLTQIATPPPAAPTVPPAPGASRPPVAPTPPPTRIEQCRTSAYHILISGRVPITSQSTDLSRALIAGGSLAWSQPEWSVYYTSAGLIAGLLYNPNSAEVGVDVFVCPPDDELARKNFSYYEWDAKTGAYQKKLGAPRLYEVGGINHHIVGHKTTPAIGTDPFAQQRALDTAVVDLANQLDCVIWGETQKMGLSGPPLDSVTNDPWCTGPATEYPVHGYFAHLELNPAFPNVQADYPVSGPIDGLR
jgi:hypothetical protein